MKLRLDHDGFRELLTSAPVADMMQEIADRVGSHVSATDHAGNPVEVLTGTYTTDRVNGVVTMAHPAAMAIEAAHGPLARALAEEGLPLTGSGT